MLAGAYNKFQGSVCSTTQSHLQYKDKLEGRDIVTSSSSLFQRPLLTCFLVLGPVVLGAWESSSREEDSSISNSSSLTSSLEPHSSSLMLEYTRKSVSSYYQQYVINIWGKYTWISTAINPYVPKQLPVYVYTPRQHSKQHSSILIFQSLSLILSIPYHPNTNTDRLRRHNPSPFPSLLHWPPLVNQAHKVARGLKSI